LLDRPEDHHVKPDDGVFLEYDDYPADQAGPPIVGPIIARFRGLRAHAH